MLKVQPNTEVTGELVTKIIKRFKGAYLPRMEKLNRYYQAQNVVLNRALPPEKPNNRLAHGFARYITNMATGYFMGEGLRYEAEDAAHQQDLNAVLEGNYTKDVHFEVAKEMSKKGSSFELLYINEKGALKFRKFCAEEIIPVYSMSVGEFLEFAVRIWDEEDLLSNRVVSYAEAYTKQEKILYRGDQTRYVEVARERHFFQDVPVIVYWNNEDQKGDYEDVVTLIDAYDKAQSDSANDFEYFTDAYLVLIGAGGGLMKEDGSDQDAIRTLKQERVLLLDEKGQAEWLIKQINDTAVENFKNRVRSDIFFLAQVPALTDESFAGNLSGVAIRYKLVGLEQLAVIKENKFMAAQKKKLKLITQFINTKRNRNHDPGKVQVIFDRNIIQNLEELARVAADLQGIVSKETQLKILPIVEDVKGELKRIKKEREEEENIGKIDWEGLALLEGEG